MVKYASAEPYWGNEIGEANGVLMFTSENASDPNEGKLHSQKAINVSFADEGIFHLIVIIWSKQHE